MLINRKGPAKLVILVTWKREDKKKSPRTHDNFIQFGDVRIPENGPFLCNLPSAQPTNHSNQPNENGAKNEPGKVPGKTHTRASGSE